MNEKNCMCYITYAVPGDMMPHLMPFFQKETTAPDLRLYPEGFMPVWFSKGCFPEDDIED